MTMPRRWSLEQDAEKALEIITASPGQNAITLFTGKNLKPIKGTNLTSRRRIAERWGQIRYRLIADNRIRVEGRNRGQLYYPATDATDFNKQAEVHTPKAVQILGVLEDAIMPPTPFAYTPPHALNFSNQHYPLTTPEQEALINTIEQQFEGILFNLGIDTVNDHNSAGTARRVAKMWVKELCHGRFNDEPKITTFPNASGLNQMVLSGPIRFVSMCSHHWQPIVGEAYCAYIPGQTVLGLSKLSRIVEFYARRPQIQEELTHQIADHIQQQLFDALGVAVLLRSSHGCMTHRGVNDPDTVMTTSDLRGVFLNNPAVRQEFYDLCRDSKGGK